MKKTNATKRKRPAVPEYDFSQGVRGKYAARYAEGTNVVVLAPDVAEVFPDAQAVNEALRTLVAVAILAGRKTAMSKGSHYHNKGQTDRSKGKYNPPHSSIESFVRQLISGESKSERRDRKSYDAGRQNHRRQKG